MNTNTNPVQQFAGRNFAFGTDPVAVRRLLVLNDACSPACQEALLQACIKEGMHVAEFGCGTGTVARTLARLVGAAGSVTGIDSDRTQIEEAGNLCRSEGLTNISFVSC